MSKRGGDHKTRVSTGSLHVRKDGQVEYAIASEDPPYSEEEAATRDLAMMVGMQHMKLSAFGKEEDPSWYRRLRAKARGLRYIGRPRERVVTLQQIEEAVAALRAESDKRPSQADVARRLNEPKRNVERTLQDNPGAWERLNRP